MTTVFDAPVATVGGKHALRVGLLRRSAGDTISEITGVFAAFFICGFPLNKKSLSDVRKIQIIVEFSCGPDFADFNPTVIRWVTQDKIRILPVFKIKCYVLKKSGLIIFYSEVVMSFAIQYQIVGDLALGQ